MKREEEKPALRWPGYIQVLVWTGGNQSYEVIHKGGLMESETKTKIKKYICAATDRAEGK